VPSEARAFVASDGAENPIGLLLARSLHHSRALELARATPRPTVRVHFFYLFKESHEEGASELLGAIEVDFRRPHCEFPTQAAIVKNWYSCEKLVPDG